jgi:transposase
VVIGQKQERRRGSRKPSNKRRVVLWRRTSFVSQSEADSVFVARMLMVVTSLRSQNLNDLVFMTEAICASNKGSPCPSLLPQESPSTKSIRLAA